MLFALLDIDKYFNGALDKVLYTLKEFSIFIN